MFIGRSRFILYYGLALSSKQFPWFMLPWILIRERKLKEVVLSLIVFTTLCSPFIIDDSSLFIHRMLENTNRHPEGFSWMTTLSIHGVRETVCISKLVFYTYLLVLTVFAFILETDVYSMAALTYTLFIPSSKLVLEQYFLWPVSFLLILAYRRRLSTAIPLFFLLSTTVLFYNQRVKLLYGAWMTPLNLLIAVSTILFTVEAVVKWRRKKE